MTRFDAVGFEGMVLDYAVAFFMALSALCIFIYLYRKKRLDFDEEAKYEMMGDDTHE